MSPPPLGERTRYSKYTNSHFDSHTMSDHEPDIPKIPYLPPLVWEVEPSITYGTLALLYMGHCNIPPKCQ